MCNQASSRPFAFVLRQLLRCPASSLSLEALFLESEGGTGSQVEGVLLLLGSEAQLPHPQVGGWGAAWGALTHNHLQTHKLFCKNGGGMLLFVADCDSASSIRSGLSPAHQQMNERKCLFRLIEDIVLY